LGRRNSRVTRIVMVGFSVLAILALVVLSPLWLRAISTLPSVNWEELSNVGQTYGAVSAVVSALALIGVSVSILLQLREVRFNRLEAGRTRHYELVRLAMENPAYLDVFRSSEGASIETRQAVAFINLYLQFWQMLWEFSDISETELRVQALDLFGTSSGRDYWRQYGQVRLRNDNTKRERKFDRTLDSVYRQVVASSPPADASPSLASMARIDQPQGPNKLGRTAIAFTFGITVGWFVRAFQRYGRASDRGDRR
jgi:hypothetical protein